MRTVLFLLISAHAAVAQSSPRDHRQLVGVWKLDSLSVTPTSAMPDSARPVLSRYEAQLAGATTQFRTGAMVITTEYRSDSTFVHRIVAAGAEPVVSTGRWTIDDTGVIGCPVDERRRCPHHGAMIVSVSADEMIANLSLAGRASGITERFKWVRARER